MRRKRSFFLRAAEQIPFRRRGKTYIALIVLILAALAAVSVGIGLREGLEAPIRTVKAVPYESGSGYFSTGYIVRDEAVMTMDSSITSLVPAEGERVSAGQAVAMGYVSADAQTRQRKIAKLEERLKELEYASAERVEQLVRTAMDEAKEGGGFILMPTATPINIPLAPKTEQNLITMIEAAHRWGRY